MTSTDHSLRQAWPTCALGAWAAAWIAGRCSPDDVTDTLAGFADLHTFESLTGPGGPDASAAGGFGSTGGVLALLAHLRVARGLSVRLPGPGAPQGLPPDPATDAAYAAGEVLLVDDGAAVPLALIPTEHDGGCRWRGIRYGVPVGAATASSAGEIEYELREAVTEATEMIGRLGGRAAGMPVDLRGAIRSQTQRHLVDLPPHDDPRVGRLLATAAQVEAIVSVAAQAGAGYGQTAQHWESGEAQLRSLTTLTRAARAAAVNRVISEFLPAT